MSRKLKSFFYIFLFQLIGVSLMFLYTIDEPSSYKIIYAFSLILLVGLVNFYLNKKLIGYNMFYTLVTMLFSIGVLEIFRLSPTYGIKQMFWYAVGVVLMYVAYIVIKSTNFHEKWYFIYVGLIYFFLLYTFIFGQYKYGAKNWISIFGHLFQPSEFIKALFIIQLASFRKSDKFQITKYKLINEFIAFTYLGFLFLQRDLGSAFIIFAILMMYLYFFEEDRRYFWYTFIAFMALFFLGLLIFNHVKLRFKVWLNPFKYANNEGYQVTTGLVAMANGGLFGTGVGLGIPNIIPVNVSDMILAAIFEEMGGLMLVAIIIIYLIFLAYGLKLSTMQNDIYYKTISVLTTTAIVIQFFVILCGNLNLMPLTGITAPFISYGGSSMLSSFLMIGVLQASLKKN